MYRQKAEELAQVALVGLLEARFWVASP